MRRLWPLFLLLAAHAAAEPAFLATFKKTYSITDGSKLAGADCVICHTEVPRRNVYGKAVATQANGAKVTSEILHSLDAKDSDGDGWSNADEIAAGTLPGNPASHPAGKPKVAAPPPQEKADLIPKHSGHPIIIHFPIALFLFGAFLDRLGARRWDDGIRRGAEMTMGAGALTSLLAIATGFIAALRLGYSLLPGGPVFIHLALAISASVAMLLAMVQRRRKPDAPATLVVIVIACILLIAAGHFGGGLVYDR